MKILGQELYQSINLPLSKRLDTQQVLITAHRGVGGGVIIENTIEGALLAFQSEADLVEFDVTRSLDGTYWVFHHGYEGAKLGIETNLTELKDADIEQLVYQLHPVNQRARKIDRLSDFLSALSGRFLTCDRSWNYWDSGLLEFLDQFTDPAYLVLKSDPDQQALTCLQAHQRKYPYMPIVRSEAEIRRVLDTAEINCIGFEILASDPSQPLADKGLIRELVSENLLVLVNCETLEDGRDLFCGWDDYVSVVQGSGSGWDRCLASGANLIHTDYPWLVRGRVRHFLNEQGWSK